MRTRQEFAAFLKQKWQTAKQSLEAARSHRKDVERENSTETMVSAGYLAYEQALKAENLALTEYARMTRVYTDFLLHREVPEEKVKTAGGA